MDPRFQKKPRTKNPSSSSRRPTVKSEKQSQSAKREPKEEPDEDEGNVRETDMAPVVAPPTTTGTKQKLSRKPKAKSSEAPQPRGKATMSAKCKAKAKAKSRAKAKARGRKAAAQDESLENITHDESQVNVLYALGLSSTKEPVQPVDRAEESAPLKRTSSSSSASSSSTSSSVCQEKITQSIGELVDDSCAMDSIFSWP